MIKAAIQLMRLDKPIGIYLLWFPTAWALQLAYPKQIPLNFLIYFALGTLFMRSAGCVINDIADRRIDIHVWRTKNRPLATGNISLTAAWAILLSLLLAALLILIQLPKSCFDVALIAVGFTFIYPFCKRFIPTPQMVLSLAFACSIPMVNRASLQPWTLSWTLLSLITLLWVVAYDTEYALADLEDDLKIGVLSTARFFGRHVRLIIAILQLSLHSLWFFFAKINQMNEGFYWAWAIAWLFWLHQWYLLSKKQKEIDFQAFKLNAWYGLWMWISLICAHLDLKI
jgi:4-hydroxybenzoate polyprenyltransferase